MILPGNRIWETTSTAGAGTAFTLLGSVDADEWRTFAQEIEDGEEVYYCRYQIAPLAYEAGYGAFDFTLNKITPTLGKKSSAMAAGATTFIPIDWSGTQNVIGAPAGEVLVYADNDLAEVEATAFGMTLLRAASVAAQRTALGLDDSPLSISSGQSGGTIGKFVRPSGSNNTWTDASQIDTETQLEVVCFKESSSIYRTGGRIALSGLTAGTRYYLSTSGGYTPTPPAPASGAPGVRQKFLGVAINATELLFMQDRPIGKS